MESQSNMKATDASPGAPKSRSSSSSKPCRASGARRRAALAPVRSPRKLACVHHEADINLSQQTISCTLTPM